MPPVAEWGLKYAACVRNKVHEISYVGQKGPLEASRPTPCSKQGQCWCYISLLRSWSCWVAKISKGGRFQSLSEPLFQCSTVLQGWSHKCQIERNGHFHKPAGYALANAAQDEVVHLCQQTTTLTHTQLLVLFNPHVLFLKTAFDTVGPQPLLLQGLLCHRLHALIFIKLHQFSVSPSFQPAKIPPSGSSTAQCVEGCAQHGIVRRPAENALHPSARL